MEPKKIETGLNDDREVYEFEGKQKEINGLAEEVNANRRKFSVIWSEKLGYSWDSVKMNWVYTQKIVGELK